MRSLRKYARRQNRRRAFRLPSSPKDFVERFIPALGSLAGMVLVSQMLELVKESGDPDPWILEVAQARDRGDLGPAVAHFLIHEIADAAMTKLIITHPALFRLTALAVVIMYERGSEADAMEVEDWPPEWRAALQKWITVFDELFTEILLRTEQHEIADAHARGDEGLYVLGKALIFGTEGDPLH